MNTKDKHACKARSFTGQLSALLVSCFLVYASGCTAAQENSQAQGGSMQFAIIGDMPYVARQEKEFVNVMKEINAADLAFVIHTGDFWFDGLGWKENTKGLPPCADETFDDRLKLTEESKHPFIITPGDNDWTDCYRAKERAYDPLERLAKFRKMYYSDDHSLGQHKIKLTSQSKDPRYAEYRENVRWSYGGVQFVTLHMTGSNNNKGRTPEMDKEYAERNAANLEWMREAFEQAKKNGSKAIMIISQANPHFENTWAGKLQKRYMLGGLGIKPPKEIPATGFDDFLAVLEEETLAFKKPVAYVHGDTHTFRVDKPLVGSFNGGKRFIENFTRMENFGFPNSHWIRVTIDLDDPNVFRFTPQIVKANLAKH